VGKLTTPTCWATQRHGAHELRKQAKGSASVLQGRYQQALALKLSLEQSELRWLTPELEQELSKQSILAPEPRKLQLLELG